MRLLAESHSDTTSKDTATQQQKQQPLTRPPLTRRDTKRVILQTERTPEELDVAAVKVSETRLQTSPPTRHLIANLEVSIFQLSDTKWVPIDGGISRLVIYLRTDENKYHIVGMSSEKKVPLVSVNIHTLQFVVNGIITEKTRYKLLSDTFIACAAKYGVQLKLGY